MKKEIHQMISDRFIECAPTESVASEVTKAMTPNNVEKYMYVKDSFGNCPKAWQMLKEHYNRFGEESKLKMNAMYSSQFKKLNDEGKCLIIEAVSSGGIKTGSKFFKVYFLLLNYISDEIKAMSMILPIRAEAVQALKEWHDVSKLSEEKKTEVFSFWHCNMITPFTSIFKKL